MISVTSTCGVLLLLAYYCCLLVMFSFTAGIRDGVHVIRDDSSVKAC